MSSDREAALANLHHLLARTLSSPLEMTAELPAQLRSTLPNLDPEWRETAGKLADSWEEALEDPDALAFAYARLFLGPFEVLAPPYASMYLEPDQRLMGEISRGVARTYADSGLAPGPGPREAPDHVAVELEFLYFLTYKYVTTGEGSWLDRRRRFESDHMQKWVPIFAQTILATDTHPFYNAIARLLPAII